MLVLVIAPQGGGKTAALLEEARLRCAAGRRCMLVVSEQVSFEYERMLTAALTPAEQRHIAVKSFGSLARDVFKLRGGAAVRRLGDSERRAAVRRAIEAVGDQLVYFSRHKRNEAFYEMVGRAVTELSLAGLGPEQVQEAAAGADGAAAAKLRETALIYAAYRAVIEGRYASEQDAIEAAARLTDAGFFADTTVFLDEFDSFTHQQLLFLEKMLTSADDVFCALTVGGQPSEVTCTADRTARRLRALAAADLIGVRVLRPARCRPDGIGALGRFLIDRTLPETTEGVLVLLARDPYDEARHVAAAIVELARGGVSYADIAVLCGDSDRYRIPIEAEFARYGVPFFSDFGDGIAFSPPVTVCTALLGLADGGNDTDLLLSLAGSGLCGLPEGVSELLASYCFVWQIEGADWDAPFTRNPSGFKADLSGEERRTLESIEAARAFLMAAVAEFCAACEEADGDEVLRALYQAMLALGLPDQLRALCAALEEPSARRAAREYELLTGILDNLHALLLGDRVPPREIAGLLRTEAAAVKLFDVPQMLAEVTVGDVERSRPIRKPVVFVMGAVSGVFPRENEAAGLFTERERALLSPDGTLPGSFDHLYHERLLRCYRVLTAAESRLYISSPRTDSRGAACLRSPLIEAYIAAAGEESFARWDTPLIQNEGSARLLLCADPVMAEAVLGERLTAGDPDFKLADTAAVRAYVGEDMMISPSRAESFSRCALRFFMQYLIKARPLTPAKLDFREIGNLLHYLMQRVMQQGGDRFTELPPAELRTMACQAAADYMAEMAPGFHSRRLDYLTGRLTDQAVRLLLHTQREQRATRFLSVDYELSIARGGDCEPRVLLLPDGSSVRVEGKVDRVDVMHTDDGDFIRVVDYKTGSKKFSLPEVYYGISVQMFIYLLSICEHGAARYGRPIPAGVMFQHSEPDLSAAGDRMYRMDGLLLADDRVLAGVEQEKGIFIPSIGDDPDAPKMAETLASAERLGRIGRHIDRLLTDMAAEIRAGRFAPDPITVGDVDPCDRCDYAALCRGRKPHREARSDAVTRFEQEEAL